ncbi:MAG TPA: 1-(5-phosphoribosyl)-5-[(5-phosphoribosylamino)methylideneamino]imidazole-4-carboxamide isomerase [Solirubrobacterales bacterium]|jgi:phosphoribosylformimino-5-aminoimidazole carboxamide ribotide isomerase|nr:1-(5-phosphoribosyl)-5-[(5-phosphoribosylamino)methylideneamino]imidazole-4-carboxamide isomerase [Solirubrobacterales bacterium]
MILFPAVDIRDGKAVRLTQGDYDREQIYNDDPLEAAALWVDSGATHLHVVDLDGARDGERRNLDHLARIAGQLDVPVQYGGGLRDIESLDAAFAAGAARAVIGTAAFRDRELVEQAVARFGDRIVVSADAREGLIAAQGWTESTNLIASDAVKRLAAVGVSTFVYTDIARDGMLTGPDLYGLRGVCAAADTANVIASGGIGSLDHLRSLVELNEGNLEGVIAGKALYEQKFTVAEALDALAVAT